MNNLQKLNRRVIELIHGLPWEEAIKKENYYECIGELPKINNKTSLLCGNRIYTNHPITIGRIMQALSFTEYYHLVLQTDGEVVHCKNFDLFFEWKLTNEDGSEATTEDQTEETILALLKILS